MDTLTAIGSRRSIRKYSSKPIPKNVLESLVNAARMAPTARNEQPWEFIVVTARDGVRKIADLTDYGKFIADAAACIAVFCCDTKYYLEDGCAATTNILVAATDLGLGSCWVAGDKKGYCLAIAEALGVPPKFHLVSLVALGYPEGVSKPVPKRDLQKLVHWERF